MGSMFRSEEITLCQLFLQSEAAYNCVSELGEIGLVQFRDLNPDVNAFQRKFVNEVRRCDEMERKLRFLEKEIKKDEIPMLDTGDSPEAPQPREMIDLEATFEKLENEMKEVNANAEALKRNFLELTELKHILRKTQVFFEEEEHSVLADAQLALNADDAPVLTATPLQLGFVAGVIHRERIPPFERMLWRACRGNVFLRRAEIETPLEDPVTGDQVNKSVFIIFFQGDQLKSRVKKICEGFRATLYPCPETQAERREMAIGVMTRIEDLNTVLSQTQDHRHRVLVAAAKNVKVWFVKVRKIKAIYHTLNMFSLDMIQKCLIAECWCPVDDLERIQAGLKRGTERSGSSVPSILNRMSTNKEPPTYNKINKFTSAFQNLIDAYGVGTYREVNPAPYAVITFPFLFAVMFGDAGHGVIMFLFGLFLVLKEKQIGPKVVDSEIGNTFFGGRYLIMMMGLFSIYTGMIYNDIFSKSFNIFGSSWNADVVYPGDLGDKTMNKTMEVNTWQLNPNSTNWDGEPYPFGLDPIWQLAGNKLMYINSFKMKMSVTLGVMQMLFGVVLSICNHLHFKRYLNIFCEFIPQMIFMIFIFVYLVVLIFAKWITYSPIKDNTNCAPSLLIGFINMFLFTYPSIDAVPTPSCSSLPWFSGQKAIQMTLVLLAVLCIPWMLFVKPFILRSRANSKKSRQPVTSISQTAAINADENGGHQEVVHHEAILVDPSGEEEEEEVREQHVGNNKSEQEVMHHDEIVLITDEDEQEFDFGEVFIHQTIHTIEYCLGCISNTASYLRLWALSLAHAELSEVLWNMVFRMGMKIDGWFGAIGVFLAFTPWAIATVSILLLMEGLSAFLHTLRLHWVEFQNKFYVGGGYLFTPFSFDDILNEVKPVSDD